MKKLLRFNKFNESLINDNGDSNFKNTKVTDLVTMYNDDIVKVISNTFESKTISNNPDWTIVESKWEILDKEREMNKLMFKDFLNEKFKVYFHIAYDDFVVVRGNDRELEKYLEEIKIEDDRIYNSNERNGGSLILNGKNFYYLYYAFRPLEKNRDFIRENGEYYTLNSMGCDVDIRLDNSCLQYFSDLLIGTQIQIQNKEKLRK